jgi:DNA primase
MSKGTNLTLPGGDLDKYHERYLQKRGYNPKELIDKYKIKGTGPVGEWKNRIMIPIFYKRELVSYQGRDITGQSDQRYKFLSIENSIKNPKKLLYNIDNCKKDYCGICEGIFDCWRLGDDFISTMGVSLSEAQYRLLSIYRKVYIVFDPDEAGRVASYRVAERLSILGVDAEIVDTELDHDPGDMTKEEVNMLRKSIDFAV